MIVGVPKEVKADEYRVAITPAGVRELTTAGHTVYVEKSAGVGSSIPDEDFVATGAQILDDPTPAPASISTVWPWLVSSRTPAGVMATRNSLSLTSVGTPMITGLPSLPPVRPPREARWCRS